MNLLELKSLSKHITLHLSNYLVYSLNTGCFISARSENWKCFISDHSKVYLAECALYQNLPEGWDLQCWDLHFSSSLLGWPCDSDVFFGEIKTGSRPLRCSEFHFYEHLKWSSISVVSFPSIWRLVVNWKAWKSIWWWNRALCNQTQKTEWSEEMSSSNSCRCCLASLSEPSGYTHRSSHPYMHVFVSPCLGIIC